MRIITMLFPILLWSISVNGQKSVQVDFRPKFFLTANRGYSNHVIFYKNNIVQPGPFHFGPWQLAAGFKLKERLAVETIWLRHREHSKSVAEGVSSDGLPMAEYLNSNSKGFALPVKFRYGIRNNTSGRFQVDILAGMMFVKQEADSEFTRIKGQDVVDLYYISGQSSNLYAVFGLSGRYVVWKHLELVADVGFNRILKNVPAEVHKNIIGNSTGLTGNHNIGVRYRFNLKLPKKK